MSETERLEDLDVTAEEAAWSPSRLKLIGTCGHAYDLKYNAQLEPEGVDNLRFGTAVHATIDRIHKEGAFSVVKAQPIWAQEWATARPKDSGWGSNKKLTDYDKLGPKIVMKYVLENAKATIMKSEWTFPSEEGRFFAEDQELKGIIDQIRLSEDNRIMVVDFKTSQREPDALVLRHDPQFTTYYAVAKKKYGEEPLLAWYHLRNGKLLFTERTDEDVAELAALMREGKQREQQKMFSKNYGFHCGWCSYKTTCLTVKTVV